MSTYISPDEKDEMVFLYHMSAYLCKHDNFNRLVFIEYVIQNRLMGAYPDMANALNNDQHNYNVWIRNFIEILVDWGLATRTDNTAEYRPTQALKLLCPTILRYQIISIRSLVDSINLAHSTIRQNENFLAIFSLLENLDHQGQLPRADVTLDDYTLNTLSQYNIIELSMNNNINITNLGRILRIRQ